MSKEELPDGAAVDFVFVSGDAYVDHPSFATAIIGRILEDAGFTLALSPSPITKTATRTAAARAFACSEDPDSALWSVRATWIPWWRTIRPPKNAAVRIIIRPNAKSGFVPDRAVIVYCNRIREAYGDVPILIGGVEASLRRFAHYDYWDDKVRRSILIDSRRGYSALRHGRIQHDGGRQNAR